MKMIIKKYINMKDFINILVTFIITGFTVGLTYVQMVQSGTLWGILYLPLFVIMIAWGIKLDKDYKYS